MILIRREKVITHIKHYQKFFILDYIKLKNTIIVGYKKFIYIIIKNQQIKI